MLPVFSVVAPGRGASPPSATLVFTTGAGNAGALGSIGVASGSGCAALGRGASRADRSLEQKDLMLPSGDHGFQAARSPPPPRSHR